MLKQFFRSRSAVLLLSHSGHARPVAASQSATTCIPFLGSDLEEAMPSGIKLSDSVLRHAKPLRADVDVVLVPVTVTDPMNRPVLGLQKQDFKVYENNTPEQVQYFSAEEAPISVGLLLDTSKSMTNKFVTERAAAEEFFKNANPQDDYFVITFADRPRLLTTSITSIEDMQETLTAGTPDGHTALLDAIYLATRQDAVGALRAPGLADHLRWS